MGEVRSYKTAILIRIERLLLIVHLYQGCMLYKQCNLMGKNYVWVRGVFGNEYRGNEFFGITSCVFLGANSTSLEFVGKLHSA